MPGGAYNVLFLCTKNAARSVIAEAIVNRNGHGRFREFSAGVAPASQVRPEVVELLKRMQFNAEAAYTKSLNEFAQSGPPPMDFVFTLCDETAERSCPVWPGQSITALWPITDPCGEDKDAGERVTACARTYRELNNRLSAFMTLPVERLDALSLRDGLGRSGGDSGLLMH